ncbi:response regulator [Frigidibacter oleivorans]|uniref:response regulator n=1 Tax=Frigidibacter oleivorans TaxID=2487129 RepID=UPI000F8E5ADE|nr:response regulator [Frigidibacter oleivorans]
MTWNPPETRLLYLEDEPVIALETVEVLRELGFRAVTTTATLSAAQQALRDGMPDLALLDVSLARGESALDLARELLEQGVPVVLATGYSAEEIAADPRADVLEKPFGSEDLEAALRRALQRR